MTLQPAPTHVRGEALPGLTSRGTLVIGTNETFRLHTNIVLIGENNHFSNCINKQALESTW